jgi:hypothetical protein
MINNRGTDPAGENFIMPCAPARAYVELIGIARHLGQTKFDQITENQPYLNRHRVIGARDANPPRKPSVNCADWLPGDGGHLTNWSPRLRKDEFLKGEEVLYLGGDPGKGCFELVAGTLTSPGPFLKNANFWSHSYHSCPKFIDMLSLVDGRDGTGGFDYPVNVEEIRYVPNVP